jgi:hypothetical protein
MALWMACLVFLLAAAHNSRWLCSARRVHFGGTLDTRD